MKKIIIFGLIALCAPLFASEPEELLSIYRDVQTVYDVVIDEKGDVDYGALKNSDEHMQKLNRFTEYIAKFDPETIANKPEKIAFLSNAYNIFTLIGVTKAWPTESVTKIRAFYGFFTKDEWMVNGKEISLNKLEKRMIKDLDPRTHFIINCASFSCPVLDSRVLTAKNVEQIMEESTIRFLNDETKNKFDNNARVWRLSKIFDWYKDDFGGKKGVIAFIQKYRKDLTSKPEKVKHLEYDWALNGPTS